MPRRLLTVVLVALSVTVAVIAVLGALNQAYSLAFGMNARALLSSEGPRTLCTEAAAAAVGLPLA